MSNSIVETQGYVKDKYAPDLTKEPKTIGFKITKFENTCGGGVPTFGDLGVFDKVCSV